MKLVIQRVGRAELSSGGELVSEIGKGLLVLAGFHLDDTVEKADYMADKLSKMRIMADENDKMNKAVKETGGEFLVVSQFTLYADTSGGNRPSFIKAARPETARPLYERLIERLKLNGEIVKTGKFGEYMKIDCELDGPVTIVLEK